MPKKHPPFVATGPGYAAAGEWMTEAGAHALAARIAAAWAKIGITMRTVVEPGGRARSTAKGMSNAMFVVRMPDLVNGMPVRAE